VTNAADIKARRSAQERRQEVGAAAGLERRRANCAVALSVQ
jgi:hypothetical protein